MTYVNIHPKAQIGHNVKIGDFTTIEEDVQIGENTWIGPNVCLFSGTRIGKNCKIFPGAVLGGIPQDLKFNNEKTFAFIGDNTVIREYVTVNLGTGDKGKTVVGNDCLLMAYVHIGHDSTLAHHCVLANCVHIAGHTEIEEWAIIEGVAGTQQFTRIGAHAFIGAGCMARKNVPPFIKVAREPLSYIGVNIIGLRRRNFSEESIKKIEQIYKVIYVKNNHISKALDILEKEFPKCEELTIITNFIKNSSKGIIRGFTNKVE